MPGSVDKGGGGVSFLQNVLHTQEERGRERERTPPSLFAGGMTRQKMDFVNLKYGDP